MTIGNDIERDIALVGHLDAVPKILQVLCGITGIGFAAIARVTAGSWTACAVLDQIAFGVKPGSTLDVETTLCKEVRASCLPIVIRERRPCLLQAPYAEAVRDRELRLGFDPAPAGGVFLKPLRHRPEACQGVRSGHRCHVRPAR